MKISPIRSKLLHVRWQRWQSY